MSVGLIQSFMNKVSMETHDGTFLTDKAEFVEEHVSVLSSH